MEEPHREAADLQALATARIDRNVASRRDCLDSTVDHRVVELVENGAEFLKRLSVQAGLDAASKWSASSDRA